jgi:hypothetical protein
MTVKVNFISPLELNYRHNFYYPGIFIEGLREATKYLRVTDVLKPAVIVVIWRFHREAVGNYAKLQSDRCFES